MEDEDYAYSEEYYASLLWMAPEKLKEICRELLTQGKDEIIQIDKETIIDKEQSVSILPGEIRVINSHIEFMY